MPKIQMSDKQLPPIPSDELLEKLHQMCKRATPGERNIIETTEHHGEGSATYQVKPAMAGILGRADAELAAALHPDLVRGLLYKIALLEEARTDACNMLQDALGKDITSAQASKLAKLMGAGRP